MFRVAVVVFNFLPELYYEIIYRTVRWELLRPPNLVQNLVPRYRLIGMSIQELEQLHFIMRQGIFLFTALDGEMLDVHDIGPNENRIEILGIPAVAP